MSSPWLTFWTVTLAVGLGAYYLVALAVVPLGARDIRRLFQRLEEAQQGRGGKPKTNTT